jgi:hypothetical protein
MHGVNSLRGGPAFGGFAELPRCGSSPAIELDRGIRAGLDQRKRVLLHEAITCAGSGETSGGALVGGRACEHPAKYVR